MQKLIALIFLAVVITSCSSSRHVPDGSFLLDKVNVEILDDSTHSFDKEEMAMYVRQMPNHKIFWTTKLQLGIYNMSGKDSTKWYNRWIRKIGEAPVIFDSLQASHSAAQLRRAMVNKGFLDARVDVEEITNVPKKKIRINYKLHPGQPHVISKIIYDVSDDSLRSQIDKSLQHTLLHDGINLDRNLLDAERDRITQFMRNRGYYAFNKEWVTFSADTTENSLNTELTMRVAQPVVTNPNGALLNLAHPYYIRSIKVVTDYNPVVMQNLSSIVAQDSIDYNGIEILYGDKSHYLRPNVIDENCFIKKGLAYSARDVERTYQAFSRLEILKFINIQFTHVATIDGTGWLDAYILLTPGKTQSVALEIEGTNSEGDLGVAAAISYTHRNIGKGSETLTAKLRGAYESLSGNLDGFIHNRYLEYSLDVALKFPKFKAPFLSKNFKQKIRATTELSVSMNYQERPEYTRIISTAAWSYKWTEHNNRLRHIFSPLDINYVYLPESTNDFINQIAPDNPLLRYSYEDHFIMSMAYKFFYTTKRPENRWSAGFQKDVSTIRASAECAGNLLYALNNIFNHRDHSADNPYKVFGIHYSQYFKIEGDYSYTHIFDHRNSLALHCGLGVAYPYGNSKMLPFEKRFYGGGANGVRGWDVRTLGPGSYKSSNTVSSFINQCGDIRFDMSIEYRAKVFWIIELAAFIDCGNIWTIHTYANQPGGMFHFDTFYKQLAASYGLGVRFDFNYFLLRVDMGMKAHNPAEGSVAWPIFHPRWGRDSSFHFSIGYPF